MLIEKEGSTAAEAKQLVERARTDAFSVQEDCSRAIAAEVAAIKREGEETRESERQRYLADFERKLQALREDAKVRAQTAINAVVALVLPRGAR
ncbi:MAG: hypothetical protein SGI88_06820 [Candidatus Hydrogenedentes bacterium]|nr:hypothetical protein [Candidatus Hydrogenedentota bacterium]